MPKMTADFVWGEALLTAMASRHRLVVLDAIRTREMSVGELCRVVGLSQSSLSQHLAKLRALNLVSTRRDGQTIYYRCASDDAKLVLDALAARSQVPEAA